MNRFTFGIVTDRVAEAAEFYREHFGFQTAHDHGWYVQLKSADGQCELSLLSPRREQVPAPLREPYLASGCWLNINVDDVDAWYRRMIAAGVPIAAELVDQPWGERHFIVTDPAGLAVNIASQMHKEPKT